jgi:tRNA pseudouridine13 synthase
MYKLKQLPEDFVVKEIISKEIEKNVSLDKNKNKEQNKDQNKSPNKNQNKYLYFKLYKKSWNTLTIIQKIAQALNINSKDFGFAGSKDKNAVTEQLCSVKCTGKLKSKNAKEILENIKFLGVKIEVIGYANEPINLGNLEGNEFEIIIRNLEKNDDVISSKNYFVNYFDEQRFSKNNVAIGRYLIKKKFKKALELIDNHESNYYLEQEINKNDFVGALKKIPKKLLLMFVHAYQSYLWNEIVAKHLKLELGLENIKEIDYKIGEDNNGKLIVPLRKDSFESFAPIKIPLLGFLYGFEDYEESIQGIVEDIMGDEDLEFSDFVIKQIPFLSAEGAVRNVVEKITGLNINQLENDELNEDKYKIKIAFSLNKGNYATMVVKQLLL